MKTFKLKSFFILKENSQDESRLIEVPLIDGLIINKEEEQQDWIMEILIRKNDLPKLEQNLQNSDCKVEVTITRRENPPAAFFVKLNKINQLEDHVSILFHAVIIRDKEDMSDIILRDLVDNGYSGEDLYTKFIKIKKDRGQEYRDKLANYLKEQH